ncbi:MAG TPA: hypothetical protein VF066_02415 [Thermoleophilaceae bacterium]
MLKTVQRTVVTGAGLAALALGGSAIAGAASNTSTSTTSGTTTTQSGQPRGDRPQQQALSSDVAAKVKAAALDKVPGATVLRTEAGGPGNSAYHAHIRTSDGTLKVVLVNASFEATAVQADNGPGRGGPGGRGHGGPGGHSPEAPLTGTTKQKVEDAVLAKYDGATIVRTETNTDSSAPYESHIKTKDGKELEVTVSKDFEIVAANEQPAHP